MEFPAPVRSYAGQNFIIIPGVTYVRPVPVSFTSETAVLKGTRRF